MASGEFSQLHEVGSAAFGRALALHLGAVLVRADLATWAEAEEGRVVLVSKRGLRIPIESFVQERLLLGASGDNVSSLEALVAEASSQEVMVAQSSERDSWWHLASADEIREISEQVRWTRAVLRQLGAELHHSLGDLEELDRVIEHSFEPGGDPQEVAKPVIGEDVERFVVGLGLLVGDLVSKFCASTWYTHELPEGFSLKVQHLGRIFPIAQMQRRVYLSSAADSTTKLGSFAFGIAAAVIAEKIRAGVYSDRAHVVTAFKELLPRVAEFSESELEGVIEALFQRSRP